MFDRDTLAQRIARAFCELSPPPDEPLVHAAVLVPLVERPEGLHVILTRRTEDLRDHAGQISFPGGRIEPSDASVEAAALRETHEEIGISPAQVDVLGRLRCYRTGTGYWVHPVVGLLRPPLELRPEPGEVAEIFEVPLAFFLDPGNHQPHLFEHQGRRYQLVAMPYGEYFIWGATAGMLRCLYQALVDEERARGA